MNIAPFPHERSERPSRHRRRKALRRRPPPPRGAWTTPIVALALLLGIVAGAIIVGSVTQRHVQLDDGTVWVTSLSHRKAARFNVRNNDADAGVASSSARFDIVQHEGDTVLAEATKASGIAASTVSTTGETAITSGMRTLIGGDTVAFINTANGDVWAGSAKDVGAVAPTSDAPKMRLGTGGRIVVTDDGTVYGYRPSDGAVLELDMSKRRVAQTAMFDMKENVESFTVIGGVPVIAANGTVRWPGGGAHIGVRGIITLQDAPVDGLQRGWVAAATPHGLSTVDLATGSVADLPHAGSGETVRPVSVQGRVHAAWAQNAENYLCIDSPDMADAGYVSVKNVDATCELVFRVNHRLALLNDVGSGDVWNPRKSVHAVKIQWNTVDTGQTRQQERNDESADNQRAFSKTCSPQSERIKAEDDVFGGRVGSRQILDVLRNDEQTDCAVLRITSTSAPSGADVAVSPIYDGRYLQLDASAAGAGTVTFGYGISDGRGQTSEAKVTLTLSEDGNGAPTQTDIPPEIDVEQGATHTTNALGSFTDPDGDPLTLVSATARNTDQVSVSTRADGQLTFDAGSMTSGRAAIEVTVSDGEQTGTGMLYFSVKPANTLGAAIDPVSRQTTPGIRTVIDLAPYVHGTSAEPARLTAVEPPSGVSTTMNAADMTIAFTASDPGTYYVPYTITQGSVPATGLARVEVRPVTGDAAKPIVADDVALLGSDGTAIVEPLGNDIDPMGGVLAVTDVSTEASTGITTGVVDGKRVYVTARQAPVRPVRVTYAVANAAGSSTGVIVLQPPTSSAVGSPPKAGDVTAQVRAGGVVSVDVLDHVVHADGTTVSLRNDLRYDEKTFAGLAFVSGDTVRYQASRQTGSFPVDYTVTDGFGNTASATITFSVHRKDASGKTPPAPADVEAQVASGRRIRIPITLAGVDADGDDVQLLGLGNKAPSLGRIDEIGADYLVYAAYADSTGTDTFAYAVEDWTGQRAQAQIRVGVFPSASDSGVYARDDEATLRPGTAATVPVLQNDISGDGTALSIERVESEGLDNVRVADGMLSFTAPQNDGAYHAVYTARNEAGLNATAILTVHVDGDAPIEPPTARDYRVPSYATIDRKSVDVDVSQWIANPSGTFEELRVGVHESAADHARVKGGEESTVITVELTDEARAVPYTVTNTTHGVAASAFIQVPAYGVFPPTLRPKAPVLKVNASETITINIADHVRVGAGKTAYVSDADSVSATKAGDGDLYVDDQTLRFTAPDDYTGPASITFTAVDGKASKDGTARIVNTAVLTLPITVVGRDTPAPTFSSSVIDVAAGEGATVIDLTALTRSAEEPHGERNRHAYSGGTSSNQVRAVVSAVGRLTVSAEKTAVPGTTVNVPITITYANGTVDAGVTVRVTASNRPLARVGARTVRLKAGSGETVRLLADAYNPFPETPLTVVGCVADDTSRIKVDCSSDGTASITAASGIGAGVGRVVATVRDATRSKEREVTATIDVSVVDRPDAPLLSPIIGDAQDGAVNLRWSAGAPNGSPVIEYQASWSGGGSGNQSCGSATSCRITGLSNGRTYSFTVRARNEAGWSEESNAVEGRPDKVPDTPGNVRAEAGRNKVAVEWREPDGDRSAIDAYEVTLSGNGFMMRETSRSTRMVFDIDDGHIKDGAEFTATVRAHNDAGWGPTSDASDAVRPWGTPNGPTIELRNNDVKGTVTVASIGDTRNAGCAAIALSGDVTGTMPCSGSHAFDIPQSDLNRKTYRVDAKVIGAKGVDGETRAASFVPKYQIRKPSNVTVSGRGSTCVVHWKGEGRADGFRVTADGLGDRSVGGTADSAVFDMAPWRTCSSASVVQTLNGGQSETARGTLSPAYVYERRAEIISAPTLSWDTNDRNILLYAGFAVDAYGLPYRAMLVIMPEHGGMERRYEMFGGMNRIDVGDDLDAADSHSWYVSVESTDGRAALNARSRKSHGIEGIRPIGDANGMAGRRSLAIWPNTTRRLL